MPGWKSQVLSLLTLCCAGCGSRSPSQPGRDPDPAFFVGKWADLAAAPGTADPQCCFFDSTRDDPCGPDTLILRADSSMSFTSVIDEPSWYWIEKDTLYRFRGGNREDTLKFAFTLDGDTLAFPRTPLCDHAPVSSRYVKVPE